MLALNLFSYRCKFDLKACFPIGVFILYLLECSCLFARCFTSLLAKNSCKLATLPRKLQQLCLLYLSSSNMLLLLLVLKQYNIKSFASMLEIADSKASRILLKLFFFQFVRQIFLASRRLTQDFSISLFLNHLHPLLFFF